MMVNRALLFVSVGLCIHTAGAEPQEDRVLWTRTREGVWEQALSIPPASFQKAELQRRCEAILSARREAVVHVYFFTHGAHFPDSKPDHMTLRQWAAHHAFNLKTPMRVAEFTGIPGGSMLNVRDELSIERLLNGKSNPFRIQTARTTYELIHISVPVYPGPTELFIESATPLVLDDVRQLAESVRNSWPSAFKLSVRSDRWFPFDQSFPMYSWFDLNEMPSDLELVNRSPQFSCYGNVDGVSCSSHI